MAINFNASTGGPTGGSGAADAAVTSLSTNFTTVSGTDRYALAILYTEGATSGRTVTLGGVSMGAPLLSLVDGAFEVYAMVAPATGTPALSASWTGESGRCALAGVIWTGVDQTNPRRDNDSLQVEDTTISLSMDAVANDLVVDIAVCGIDNLTANVAQTRRVTMNDFATAFRSLGMSERAGSAPTTTMNWTCSTATDMYLAAFTLVPSVASGSATVTPTPAALTMQGKTAALNPFTNVRISEVLINEANSPVSGRTGMHLMVWYDGFPLGAPDLSYSNATTGASGTLSYSLATGPLVYNQPIFYVLTDGNASGSLSGYTCARMIPTYT